MKMKIKKGDTVIVRTGNDRGKSGKVARVIPSRAMLVVEGVNIKKRHQRPRRGGQKGQIIEFSAPIHISNVAKSAASPGDGTATKKAT